MYKMKINRIILNLLNERGIYGDENINEFLSPKPLLTYDPFLLLNMKEGVDLILDAIEKDEKICIYGDYDTDGITSISILKTVLDRLTPNVSYYIPHREEEGYGMNKEAIKKIYDEGSRLLVTVDCGIVSFDEIEYAKELGMRVLVTDHHSPQEILPDCLVINPKQSNCHYPFKNLAGCGVAFKLAQAIQRSTELPKDVINEVLDIVAIGTVGDVVPLVDENRTIVKYGMNRIFSGKRKGLEILIDKTVKNKDNISSENISFNIVPHLNAAGRIESALIGVDLFMSKEENEAEEIVDKLIVLNNRRKELQENAYEECIDIYERKYKDYLFPIIKMENAHEGITGIVAGKMKEYSGKPVAIVTPKESGFKGTARGIDTIDIYEILGQDKELYEKFGGHKSACGFTIGEDKIDILQDIVEGAMSKLPEELLKPPVKYDMELDTRDVTLELAKELELLQPFGCENEKPVFKVANVKIQDLRSIGREGNHIKFKTEGGNGKVFDCIYFNCNRKEYMKISQNSTVDIIGYMDINKWRGRESLQFIITSLI